MTERPAPAARDDLGDPQLMALVQAGDSDAFGELYDRFAPRAHALARALGDETHADDVVHEAFLTVWRNRSAFRPERGTVLAWMMGTVRDGAVDSRHRQAGRESPRADAVCGDEEAARLRRTLARLPAAQRDVITLAYFGELSTSEIAAELSLPRDTVNGRMRLGLTQLRVPVDG